MIYVILSATGFATLAIFGKLAFNAGLTSSSVLAWRFLIAAALLVPYIIASGQWRLARRDVINAVGLGLIGYSIQAILFFSALKHTSAAVTSLMLYTYPAFVAVISWLVFHEKMTRHRLVALVVSLVGMVLTVPMESKNIASELTGAAIALCSGVWYACYLVFGARRVRGLKPAATSAYLSIGAAFAFFVSASISGGLQVPERLEVWGVLLAIGGLATVLPVATLFAALARLGVVKTSILSTLEPVITAVFGYMFLAETMSGQQLLGGALVLLGAVTLHWFDRGAVVV